MRLEFISKVKSNDILGKDIISQDGQVLLKSGIRLTQSYIKRLKKLGIFYIHIEDERLEDIQYNSQLLDIKQFIVQSINNTVKNIHNINNINLKESFEKTNDIIGSILNIKELISILFDIKQYNNYVYNHNLDTSVMCIFIGLSYGLTNEELTYLCIGSILHDIGKLEISNNILNKVTPLTSKELKKFKKHPIYGKKIAQERLNFPEPIIEIIEQHHERIDGKGYPYGLKGNSISIYSKIVSICSAYNFMSKNYYYRDKYKANDVYEFILSGSDTIFDRNIINCFKDTFAIYPLGSEIELSNGDRGFVIRQNKGFPDRPVLRIFNDNNFSFYYEVDLLKNTNITVKTIMPDR
ncbi:HD-GYP domain-containing protein [Clostridium botulinum]|uniref:HD-GYP domain-containing protein n=1 Tax=Clostridium botulinum TaxID=1491 RepID=UPI00137616C0|nr:HD-GYP domain-containing protein [Clostridium botulinum]NCI20838.1 HD-GYP domain-containing protein [Clostridium botulinum]NCI35252.1 HD-GYP domain-containing protein [Clostridium botulinum]NCI72156.1 HD-GYP domain-containing protein [Clostridium botulinum]NDI38269.1 HD-GYP domain-containing protein [Clostridium botulinum]